MTVFLNGAQIRGARAMLDWSMVDLSRAARISVSTVKRAEGKLDKGCSDEVAGKIRGAFEADGIRFLPDEGDGPGMRFTGSSARPFSLASKHGARSA